MWASHIACFHVVKARWLRDFEISVSEGRQDDAPGRFEVDTRVIEIHGGAILVPARFDTRIEAAPPFPLIGVERAARAPRDRADMLSPWYTCQ